MVDAVGKAKEVSTKVTGSNPVLTTSMLSQLRLSALTPRKDEEYSQVAELVDARVL